MLKAFHESPQARGNKIASGILKNLIESAKTLLGLEQIHLWVLNQNKSAAKTLYSKAGFVSQGPIMKNDLKIDGSYLDAEYMTLALK